MPFKFIFELELVVLLLVVAEAIVGRHLAMACARRPNQHLSNVLLVSGRRVSDVDAQFTVRQRPIHVVDLPVALERVDQTLGIVADECSRLRITDNLQLEKVWIGCVVTDVRDVLIEEVVVAASAATHLQRVVHEVDLRFAQDEKLAITLHLDHGDEVGCLTHELLQRLDDRLRDL